MRAAWKSRLGNTSNRYGWRGVKPRQQDSEGVRGGNPHLYVDVAGATNFVLRLPFHCAADCTVKSLRKNTQKGMGKKATLKGLQGKNKKMGREKKATLKGLQGTQARPPTVCNPGTLQKWPRMDPESTVCNPETLQKVVSKRASRMQCSCSRV